MGRDLTLYPKKASRTELKNYIESMNFQRCGHLWDWPKGTLNYSWYDYDDYKSIDGVSADIYPITDDDNNGVGCSWALHVRNLYSASWHDVKMLNDVLRGARKLFGGTIRGDYGTNKYAPLWKDESTPISRGVSYVNMYVRNELEAIKRSLPDPVIKQQPRTGDNFDAFFRYIESRDPSRVLYNGLVPFAISMFEYFFSQAFQILIKYDDSALNKRASFKQKVDFTLLLDLERKFATIESIIASNYTFQNINQLNNAYKDWLNIDVRKILYKKKKIGNSIKYLENRITEIIQFRHGIVHHFEIDRTLTKEGFIDILEAIEKCIQEFIQFLELKYKFKTIEHL